MCIQPIKTPAGLVSCRKCKQCRENRVRDYVGRAMAEAATSDRSLSLTLTYGTDHPHSDFLVYRDIQLLLKLLRYHGYSVRYICAGEYGSAKGRAHWHMILFFTGKKLELFNQDGNPVHINPAKTAKKDQVRENWPFWPHGTTYFQPVDAGGFRYVLKYILKDTTAESGASHFALSKHPPLGHAFFSSLAASYAANRFLPPSPHYEVGGKSYWLGSRSRDAFLKAFAYGYWSRHGSTAFILPDWVRDYLWTPPDHAASFDQVERHEWVLKDPHQWRAWFDNDTQPVYLLRRFAPLGAPLMRIYREPAALYCRPVQGPTNLIQQYWIDQDGETTTHFRPTKQSTDFRNAVGPRRLEHEQRQLVARVQARSAGVHHPQDTCSCSSCVSRRLEATGTVHVFQTPFDPLRDRRTEPQGQGATPRPASRPSPNRAPDQVGQVQGSGDGEGQPGPDPRRTRGGTRSSRFSRAPGP